MQVVPVLCILSFTALILVLPAVTQARFVVWMLVGLGVYFAFGMRNSTNRAPGEGKTVQEE